jgi:cyclophilin family peptidyl-prolyl cis-trans isomerase/HEAT repeat protein
MKIMNKHLLVVTCIVFCILSGLFSSCVPPEYNKNRYNGIAADFKDPIVQRILQLQDRQSVDSLIRFFRDDNPTYRYLAVRAFGSIKEKRAIDSIVRLLRDDYDEIRVAAAFSLGQIGDPRAEKALIAAFDNRDTLEKYANANAAILEAVGKCGTTPMLEKLCGIKTFRHTDTTLLLGQAYGILRFGLRDTVSDTATRKMVYWVQNPIFPTSVRLAAANYLGRVKNIRLDSAGTYSISRLCQNEKNAEIRLALVKSLPKSILPTLVPMMYDTIYRKETDMRVKVNLLRSLETLPYPSIQPLILLALRDRSPAVAQTAADFCIANGKAFDAAYYFKVAQDSSGSIAATTRSKLYGAALRWLPATLPRQRDSANLSLLSMYQTATTDYQKAEILRNLAQNGNNYPFIFQEAQATKVSVIKTAGTEALANIAAAPDFYSTFKVTPIRIKSELKTMLFALLRTADAGAVVEAAKGLRNPAAQYLPKLMKDSLPILINVLQRLKLPNEIETYDELAKTINYVVDSVFVTKKKLSNTRSIDWGIVNSINEQTTAEIRTNKGAFKIRFLLQDAPATVATWVTLAKSGFFNGKAWHRVVPSFVAQTGCPRGDGYGALDFTLRSELTERHYDTPYLLGMASAGNHTECSQWFVTAAPTLHLDGAYTMFAQVIAGQNIIQDLEVGDRIETINFF